MQRTRDVILASAMMAVAYFSSACKDSASNDCHNDSDCLRPEVCGPKNKCVPPCSQDSDCDAGFECLAPRCVLIEHDGGGDSGGCVGLPDGGDENAEDDGAGDAPTPDGTDDEPESRDGGGNDAGGQDGGDCQLIPGDGDDLGGDAPSAACPADMVNMGSFCIDRYEASRADATDTSSGSSTVAASQAGVIPWWKNVFAGQTLSLAEARAGCEAAAKHLCRIDEWVEACAGTADTASSSFRTYSYGDTYIADTCNGIDAFCYCDRPECADLPECPYAGCKNTCGAQFHETLTGSFPGCHNPEGAFDLNGNVWELVDAGDDSIHFRGGAYNCNNSALLHQCTYDATNISAQGFRCCRQLASD